jgi:hypothetical protein
MEPVPGVVRVAGQRLEQLGVHDLLQCRAGVVDRGAEQRCRLPQGEVGGSEQPEQAERAALPVAQRAVAQRHAGSYLPAADGQLVEAPVIIDEQVDEPLHRPVRPGGEAGPGKADGERKACAEPHQRRGRVLLGADPFWSGDAAEQLDRLAGGEDVEADELGAVQSRQAGSAGDQHPSARRARQHRSDLLLRGGIVQHDEDSPSGKAGTPEGGPLVDLLGDAGAAGVQRAQEPLEHLRGMQRPRAQPSQVDVVLAVLEQLAHLVGHVDRQRRLADAGHARHRAHRDRDRLVAARGGKMIPHRSDHVRPSGEVVDVAR